ncbi:MAG: HNH endonuclease, partial [Blastocatellia bacterium]
CDQTQGSRPQRTTTHRLTQLNPPMPRPRIPTHLRRLAIDRSSNHCEYCLIHQDDRPETHPIDHVIALQHGGRTVEENLALACAICNGNKGPNLSSIDPLSGDITPLFNPRTQNWHDQFELSGARIVGRTAIGRTTIALLRLNDDKRLNYRQNLIEAGRYPSVKPA